MCSIYYCISEINNTQVDNVKDIDTAMPMYNLIEYSDNYSKTSGSLWQYYKDTPAVSNNNNNNNNNSNNSNNAIVDFTNNNLTDSFNSKQKILEQKLLK